MGKRLFIFAALLVLVLPALLSPFGVDIRSYRTDGAASPEEQLALRTAAITGRSQLLRLVGESGSSQVIAGREGFLFFGETLEDYQGTSPLSSEETDALTAKLCSLQAALQAEGRRLIVLIAPNKNTIYPEMMPGHILPAQAEGLSRLNAALTNAGLTVLDAPALLTAHKVEGLLYYKGDTHWNARGARLIYQELMRLTGASAPDYAGVALVPGQAGDLTLLCQPGTQPLEPDAVPEIDRVYHTLRPMRSLDDARIQTSSQTTGLSLLVVRDSFGEGLFPYLANTAGSMTFSRSDADVTAQARSAQAQWVIIEVAQRNLRDWLAEGALV